MTKLIENNGFNELDEEFDHLNEGNGNRRTAQTIFVAEEDITPDEEQELAGYNPTTPQLISEEYRLKQDEEGALERPLAEKASVRLGSVVTLVGLFLGAGAVLWFTILSPKPPTIQKVETPNASSTPLPTFDESAELKSRLAFQDQQQELRTEQKNPPPAPKSTPPSVTQKVSQPEPIIVRRTIPVGVSQFPPIVSRTNFSTSSFMRQPEPTIDPKARWNQLASLGELRGNIPKIADNSNPIAITQSPNPSSIPAKSIPAIATPETSNIQTVLIGNSSGEGETNEMSPGMVGILNRNSLSQFDQPIETTKEVTLGSFAKAKVILPMIWDEGGNNPTERFAVELTEDLRASDKTIALPKGTVLIAKTAAVGKGNNLVSASAIALIYPDTQGKIRQETIPENTLLIQGEDNQPLIAQKLNDVGPQIAQQDLLIGLLSGLGRVGSVINQPRTQSNTITSGGTFSQSVITTTSDPEIWAAALEGFFSPTADRISQRSDQVVQELMQRPNIQFLPEGTKVSVVVNSFLKINQ
jgi:hypothetical protein